MNYTCIPDLTYIDTPDFLLTDMHIITGISTPIHFLGLYCIIFKTPKQMRSVKWYMLILHIYVMIFDYSYTIMTVPFVLSPFAAGFPLGLLRLTGMSVVAQSIYFIIIYFFMLNGIVSIFENRFYKICSFTSKNTWKFWRIVWLAGHYVIEVLLILPIKCFVPEQTHALQYVFQNLPCLPRYIYDGPVYVVAEDITYHFSFIFSLHVLICFEVIFFFGYLIRSGRQQLKGKTMSQRTFQLQKKFFIALISQVCVPSVFFIIPLIYVVITILTKYYNQGYLNIAFTIIAMHGLVSTSAMLSLHQPYRETILNTFQKTPRTLSKIQNLNDKRLHRCSARVAHISPG